MNPIPGYLLVTTFIYLVGCMSSENVYIVTSPDSHCPWELTAEQPCLTLQQYVYVPSLTSNVTLGLESGNHKLHGVGILIEFDSQNGRSQGDRFQMLAERAKVFHSNAPSVRMPSLIIYMHNVQYVHISGVTFVSDNTGFIKIEDVQRVFIEFCHFQGVQLHLMMVNNSTISRCSFSNYSSINDFSHEAGALYISQSNVVIVQSNFSHNEQAINYHDDRLDSDDDLTPLPSHAFSLTIDKSIFSNNTSEYDGSALSVSGTVSVTVRKSIFLFNSASGSGGALHLNGVNDTEEYSIVECTFVHNSATFCGAFNIESHNGTVAIDYSNFYYNRAENSNSGYGGAGCVRNASLSVSNSRFLANRATGYGGALQLDESQVNIESSAFGNNSAGYDGGALYTYAHCSNYVIKNSTFLDNSAGDDGGAMFVGRKGSVIQVDRSTFTRNSAADRGGAICVIGTTLKVTISNLYSNLASWGKQISACNSFVVKYIPARKDPSFPICAIYDNDSANGHYAAPTSIECWNISCLNDTVCRIVTKYNIYFNTTNLESGFGNGLSGAEVVHLLHQTTIISYSAVAISIFSVILLLLYVIVKKVIRCYKLGRKKKGQYFLLSTQGETDE